MKAICNPNMNERLSEPSAVPVALRDERSEHGERTDKFIR